MVKLGTYVNEAYREITIVIFVEVGIMRLEERYSPRFIEIFH